MTTAELDIPYFNAAHHRHTSICPLEKKRTGTLQQGLVPCRHWTTAFQVTNADFEGTNRVQVTNHTSEWLQGLPG